MSDSRNVLLDHFYKQQLQCNPDFCSLADSGDTSQENAFKDFARLCMENTEWKMAKFASLYSVSRSRGDNRVDELKTHSFYTENYSMQSFKDRLSMLSMTDDSPFSVLANSVPAGAHRLALRACHLDLVNNLDLHGTTLLDELVAEHFMDESDAQSIVARAEKRPRTEAFLRRLQVVFSTQNFIDSFIPVLSKYYPDAVSKLLSCMHQTSGFADFSKCFNCQMKATVEPRQLADVLYQNGIIDPNLHQDLREQNTSNQQKWDRLTTEVEDYRDVLEAVRLRLPYLYEELDLANAESFDCWCHMIITQPALPSTGDDSSASAASDIANISDLESVSGSPDDEDKSSDVSLYGECEEEDYIQTEGEKERNISSRIRDIFNNNIESLDTELTQFTGNASGGVDSPCGETEAMVPEHCETKGAKRLQESNCKSPSRSISGAENVLEGSIKQEVIYCREDNQNETCPKGSVKHEVLNSREDNQKEKHSPKRSFGTSVKSFLKRQLYSIRLLSSGHQRQSSLDESFLYDAFITYAFEDTMFVKNALGHLEEVCGMKLCIHDRDFMPGCAIANNIVDAIQSSRKTVVVLSPSFVKSHWCEFEFDAAVHEAVQRRQTGPIMVMYEFVRAADLPRSMAWRLTREPYLDYATTGGDDAFWRELVKAIKE